MCAYNNHCLLSFLFYFVSFVCFAFCCFLGVKGGGVAKIFLFCSVCVRQLAAFPFYTLSLSLYLYPYFSLTLSPIHSLSLSLSSHFFPPVLCHFSLVFSPSRLFVVRYLNVLIYVYAHARYRLLPINQCAFVGIFLIFSFLSSFLSTHPISLFHWGGASILLQI